jgi:hypothetical protein
MGTGTGTTGFVWKVVLSHTILGNRQRRVFMGL